MASTSDDACLDDIVCLRNGGLLREAVAAARYLAGRRPTEPHLRALGLLELEIGSPLHARDALEEAVHADPRSASAHCALGRAALELGDWEESLSELSHAARDDSQASAALIQLGLLHLERGENEAAQHAFLDSLKIQESKKAALGLVRAWARLSMTAQAAKLLREQLQRTDEPYETLAVMMECRLGSAPERHLLITQAWLRDRGHAGLRALRARAADDAAPQSGEALRGSLRRLLRVWDLSDAETEILKRDAAQIVGHRSWHPGPTQGSSVAEGTFSGMVSGDLFAEPTVELEELHGIISAATNSYAQELLLTSPDHLVVKSRPEHVRVRARAVKLAQGEYQETHFHPDSWLSGCLYIQVPPCIKETNPSGHLAFGAKREEPQTVFPRVGRIVLFPSCIEHRVFPHNGPGLRVSIAFDVVPIV